MRLIFFVLLATFCVSKSEALIIHESEIIQKIFNKEYYHPNYQNYFDLSDLISNDDGSSLSSGLWHCIHNGFFDGVDYSTPFNIIIADVNERYAILFKRNDDPLKYFCLDQLKYNDNDLCVVGSVIAKMKAELSAILVFDEDNPASTLKSLDEQIQSIEQTPHLYEVSYSDEEMDEEENGEVEDVEENGEVEDVEENGIEQYVMPNFLQEHLDGLKAQRDSLTEFTHQLLSLDQILARLSADETTQHLELNKKLVILQSMGIF
jgi:hypothetical protein